MSIVVAGCGRSGSNVVLEILRGSRYLQASEEIENKHFFQGSNEYPDNYLTKCDSYYFNKQELEDTLISSFNITVLYSIRDPRDMILSKIFRGQPGNDTSTLADDATSDGCIADIFHMFDMYLATPDRYKELVRLEDILKSPSLQIKQLCNRLGIAFDERMLSFPNRMRNPYKKARYKGIDKSQIALYKDWKNVYGGFFKGRSNYNIPELFEEVEPIRKYFGYAG